MTTPRLSETKTISHISSVPLSERPRERCIQAGTSCLSLRECLALIIGTGPPGVGSLGLASLILDRPKKWADAAEEERAFFASIESSDGSCLKEVPGVGPALITRILAAFELGKRYIQHRYPPTSNPPLESVPVSLRKLAARALAQVPPKPRADLKEWFGFVPVYRDGNVGSLVFIEKGGRQHVNVDPVDLFSAILALRPYGYFLFHNHPSGTLRPSEQDLELTEKAQELSIRLGIRLLGHWIVTRDREFWLDGD